MGATFPPSLELSCYSQPRLGRSLEEDQALESSCVFVQVDVIHGDLSREQPISERLVIEVRSVEGKACGLSREWPISERLLTVVVDIQSDA